MKTRPILSCIAWLLVGALFPATHSFGQFSQTTIAQLAAGTNLIEKSATSLTATTFIPAVATAWTNGMGGVLNLSGVVPNGTTSYRGNYGEAKRIEIASSTTMQNVGYNANSFSPMSLPNATTSSANLADYTLTLGLFDTNTEQPLEGEVIKQVGLVVLSRGTGGYPLDIRITATFSDETTEVATANVGRGSGVDDTFFGFIAPDGAGIVSLRLQSFTPNTEDPVADRICWDDFGFIAGAPTSTPLPVITDVSPKNGAVVDAQDGIHFNVVAYEAIGAGNITLRVNAVDVSGELTITGDSGDYSVAYDGLQPDQLYEMEISVVNSGGLATLARTFYTFTSPTVIYDAGGFSDEDIFPVGDLQNVEHGRCVWEPNLDEPAEIVDVGGPMGKVLERLGTGATRADALRFPPVSSGTLTVEVDVFASITDDRTIDISLQAETGTLWGAFLAWGMLEGKLAYYDNTAWQPLTDCPAGWHHLTLVHYLSGPAAGYYDVLIDHEPISTLVPFRNAPVGTSLGRFRIQTQNSSALMQYGQIDNLVITVGPETGVILPPTITDVLPVNHTIAAVADGVQFTVQSQVPLAESDIALRLNDNPVSLSFSGEATDLTATHAPLAPGNYTMNIQATNLAGTAQWLAQFIAADEPWMYHPSAGWVDPWQWTTSMATWETAAPMDTSGYLHYDVLDVGVRNAIRQFTDRPGVDLNSPHRIRWKFRLVEDAFATNFDSFNDRIHFYGRNAARPTGGTDSSTSWSIMATGNEQTSGSGVYAGQTFYLFDNVDGTGGLKLANLVDSHIAVVPGHIYALEVTVFPADGSYTVAIQDLTSDASFQSATPHKYRAAGVTATSHNYLHFGVQTAPATDPRAFDLDTVEILPALQPMELLHPAHDGTAFSFSFVSRDGTTYYAEYATELPPTQWHPLATISGDGSAKTVTDANATGGQRYYRVRAQ